MSKVVTVQLEWTYTPKNYLEEPVQITGDQYNLLITEGVAVAIIEPSLFAQKKDINERLTALVESRLQAVQIMKHSEYALSRPSRTEITDDGKRNVFLEIQSAVMKMTAGHVGLIVTDKNGNIITDTKKERLDKQKWFAESVAKHRGHDKTLAQILRSYHHSVGDPDNELVHLYEVRDALSLEFGGQKNALSRLGITQDEWDTIGVIANVRPLKQGRHRGKSVGILRDAEQSELEAVRKCVSNLIERYLVYLEHK